jgi:hypothetical protein
MNHVYHSLSRPNSNEVDRSVVLYIFCPLGRAKRKEKRVIFPLSFFFLLTAKQLLFQSYKTLSQYNEKKKAARFYLKQTTILIKIFLSGYNSMFIDC